MAMSKNRVGAIIILGILWIPFFVYKLYDLKNYNTYTGKVVKIEQANVRMPKFKSSGGGYETVYMPEVEFVKGSDTIVFLEGNRNYFAYFYDVGDTVTVLEYKRDNEKLSILGFWYRVKVYEVIIQMLISCILLGIYWAVRTGYFKEE
jgi:hypothetical protein